MPRVKRRARRRRDDLAWDELWDLLLMDHWVLPREPKTAFGCGAFETPWQRKAAWLAHRDRLLADAVGQGQRPGAWWEFEAPGPRLVLTDGRVTVREHDLAALVRLGEATPAEVRQFLRWHEQQFGDEARREELFRFQPQERLRYEHERALIEKLQRGEIKPKRDA